MRKIRYCSPMRRHWMTKVSANAAEALSMAKELQVSSGYVDGLQSLVKIIDCASLQLIAFCDSHARRVNADIEMQ